MPLSCEVQSLGDTEDHILKAKLAKLRAGNGSAPNARAAAVEVLDLSQVQDLVQIREYRSLFSFTKPNMQTMLCKIKLRT